MPRCVADRVPPSNPAPHSHPPPPHTHTHLHTHRDIGNDVLGEKAVGTIHPSNVTYHQNSMELLFLHVSDCFGSLPQQEWCNAVVCLLMSYIVFLTNSFAPRSDFSLLLCLRVMFGFVQVCRKTMRSNLFLCSTVCD